MEIIETTIAKALANFLSEEVLDEDIDIPLDENLLMETGVDSLGMLRMVGYIEAQYQIKIDPVNFTIQNFRDINVIAGFIIKLLNQKE